jgi:hypothetical protein
MEKRARGGMCRIKGREIGQPEWVIDWGALGWIRSGRDGSWVFRGWDVFESWGCTGVFWSGLGNQELIWDGVGMVVEQ